VDTEEEQREKTETVRGEMGRERVKGRRGNGTGTRLKIVI
jgi:hypothetical protein